jgi:hypothetical protein
MFVINHTRDALLFCFKLASGCQKCLFDCLFISFSGIGHFITDDNNMAGWHICSECQKPARLMCYTCTYSLCKGCMKKTEFLSIKGNMGFCPSCLSTVTMIERYERGEEDALPVGSFPLCFSSFTLAWFLSRKVRMRNGVSFSLVGLFFLAFTRTSNCIWEKKLELVSSKLQLNSFVTRL